MIEEGDEEEEEYEYEEDEEEVSSLEDKEVVSKDDDDYEDESISELITRTVDVSGFIGDNTELVFFGAIILAVILAFGKTQNLFPHLLAPWMLFTWKIENSQCPRISPGP